MVNGSGIQETKKKIQLSLRSAETEKAHPDIKESKHQNVKTHEDSKEKPLMHRTTLSLTSEQFEMLEKLYISRKIKGQKIERFRIVGEAIEKLYKEEITENER